MNIIKIGLIFLTGIGFTFGANQISDQINHTEDIPFQEENDGYYCHRYEEGLPMLDNLSDEDKVLVEEKLDEILVREGISEEDFYENRYVYHNIMEELMDYIYENNIDIEEYYYPGHMGRMH